MGSYEYSGAIIRCTHHLKILPSVLALCHLQLGSGCTKVDSVTVNKCKFAHLRRVHTWCTLDWHCVNEYWNANRVHFDPVHTCVQTLHAWQQCTCLLHCHVTNQHSKTWCTSKWSQHLNWFCWWSTSGCVGSIRGTGREGKPNAGDNNRLIPMLPTLLLHALYCITCGSHSGLNVCPVLCETQPSTSVQ